MHRLPPLSRNGRHLVLPLAGPTAAALGDALLALGPTDRTASLAGDLAADPPFLLWAVLLADRDELLPQNLGDVAAWLVDRLPEVLDWPSLDHQAPEPDDPLPDGLGPLVARGLAVGDLAVKLAEAGNSENVLTAALRGPLTTAAETLAAVEPDTDGWLDDLLPNWLADTETEPPEVTLARAILDGREPPAEGFDVDACRDRGEQGRLRWQAADRRAEWLPSVAAQARRLRALELRFRETVETEKLEAMAEFAAGAGHEINNPLTVISGRAQLSLRDEADPEKRRALALISAQAMRVYEMISDLMLFARPPQPEPQPINAVELLDQVIEEMAPEAGRQEIAIRRTGGDEPIPLSADPTQLTVALKAMCRNALEAIGREGTIQLCAEPQGQEVLLRLKDDGPGIPPEERRHIFDPYYSARQAGRGLGMGLSKAWRIVTNHNGRIDVESEAGAGAVFTIVLPKTQS